MIPKIGILQGRLTPSNGRGIQFFPFENWENEFELAKQIGFDCMELLNEFQNNYPMYSQNGLQEIKKLAIASAIKIESVHGFYEKTESYVTKLKQLIRQSAFIGAKTILIPFFNENILKNKEDKDFARGQISKTLALCKKLNICLGVETEMEANKLLEFIKSFEHPCVGVYYDIGNMASMEVNIPREIKLFGEFIFGVHIKDRLANRGKTVPIGTGCADFKNTFIALKEIGYEKPFILQGARSDKTNDIELNKRYFNFVKNLFLEGGK